MSDARQSALVDVRVLLLDGAHVLMAQRCDQAFAGYWNLPGGHAKPRECTICAARREIAEETGVRVTHDELAFVAASHYSPPGRSEKISFAFAARRWEGTPVVTEPDRCSTVAWHSLEHLPSSIMPQAAEAIRLLAEHRAFSTYALDCGEDEHGEGADCDRFAEPVATAGSVARWCGDAR